MQNRTGGANSRRSPASDPETPMDPFGDDSDRLHRLRECLAQQGLEVELRPGGPQLIRRRRDRWHPSRIGKDRAKSAPVMKPSVNDATPATSITSGKDTK